MAAQIINTDIKAQKADLIERVLFRKATGKSKKMQSVLNQYTKNKKINFNMMEQTTSIEEVDLSLIQPADKTNQTGDQSMELNSIIEGVACGSKPGRLNTSEDEALQKLKPGFIFTQEFQESCTTEDK